MSEEQCKRCGNMEHFMPGGNHDESESALIDLLYGRCATCKHWLGDGNEIYRILEDTEYKDNFLSIPDTWAEYGECKKLHVEMYFCEGYDNKAPEPCGVFGCILYEHI